MIKILVVLCVVTHLSAIGLGFWSAWLRAGASTDIERTEATAALFMGAIVLFMATVGWNALGAPWWAILATILATVGLVVFLLPALLRGLLTEAPKESLTGETDPA